MSVHQRPNGSFEVKYRDEFGCQKSENFGKGLEAESKAHAYDIHIKEMKKKGTVPNTSESDGQVRFDDIFKRYLEKKADDYINSNKYDELADDDDLVVDVRAESNGLVQQNGDAQNTCYPEWLQSLVHIYEKYLKKPLNAKPAAALDRTYLVNLIAREYRAKKKLSVSSKKRYLSYLKIVFNHGVKVGLIDRNPLANWSKGKEAVRQATLTVEELRRIQDHAAPHISWAIDVAYNLGVRTGKSELLALKWEHVLWDDLEVRVYAPKTDSYRLVPVEPDFLQKLKEKYLEEPSEYIVEYRNKPMKRITKGFRNACIRAGITRNVVPYEIRHLSATRMLNEGADLACVSAVLGHATKAQTLNSYYHANKEGMRRAVSLLPSLR